MVRLTVLTGNLGLCVQNVYTRFVACTYTYTDGCFFSHSTHAHGGGWRWMVLGCILMVGCLKGRVWQFGNLGLVSARCACSWLLLWCLTLGSLCWE